MRFLVIFLLCISCHPYLHQEVSSPIRYDTVVFDDVKPVARDTLTTNKDTVKIKPKPIFRKVIEPEIKSMMQ